jgi:hypothetical protein
VLFSNVRVIDGTGGEVLADRDVLVADGKISRIAKGGTLVLPAGGRQINGEGATLLPGLMDLHVHFRGLHRFAGELVTDPAKRSDVYRYKSYLYSFLYAGVTTVLDEGTEPILGISLKPLIEQEYVLGPRYYWCGPIFEGGVESSFGYSFGIASPVPVPTSEKVPQVVDFLVNLDADFMKLYRKTPVWMIQLLTEEAHKRGLRVIVDSWERNNFSYLTRIGRSDGWAHVNFFFPLTADDVREVAVAKQFVISTLYAANVYSGRVYEKPGYLDSPLIKDVLPPEYLQLLKDGGDDPHLSTREMLDHYVIGPLRPAMGIKAEENIKDVLRRQAKVAADNIRRLHEAGVLVATGTDGGQGESLLSELEFLVEDTGLPPLTVLQMATSNAAKVLELDDRLGMVREGHLADLVLVDGRPDENIHDIRNIREVMKNGKLINRESLTHQWSY